MISVDQLVDVPTLGLRYLAGEGGGARLVTWAHACDLDDPWNWVQPGDLVMTTGAGIPTAATKQKRWIQEVINGRASALVIAPGPTAPTLTKALIAEAKRHEFPLLTADFALHFVELARTVIEREIASERARLADIRRLHEAYLRSLRSRGGFSDRLLALELATRWGVEVRDLRLGIVLARSSDAVADVDHATGIEIVVPLEPSGHRAVVISAKADSPIDRSLAEHLAGLVALDLEHVYAGQDQLRAVGERMLLGLLDGSTTMASVRPLLEQRGITGQAVIAFWTNPDRKHLNDRDIQHSLALQEIAPLFVTEKNGLLGLVPDDANLMTSIGYELSPECIVGISAVLRDSSTPAEAARQARLASTRASEPGNSLRRYDSEDSEIEFFPHSVEDSRRLVSRILGPLIAYDLRHGSDLLHTVQTFLDNDGAWQTSADLLRIHRQTLNYRLRRVDEICGYSPVSTSGAAMLWLALATADKAGIDLRDK